MLLYRLGDPALKNWDEGVYAEVAKEMLLTGDWLDLKWQHAVWFEKPPLTFWAVAILFRVFAINEFWARAISAFSGVGVVAIIYAIGKLIRGRACGVVAALILLTTFQFVQFSRLLTTDVLLLFFIFLAIYSYLRVRAGDPRWWYLVSISCALGFMVKDFAILAAPAAIGLALCFDRQLKQTIKSKHFWFSILAGLMIVIPWHAVMYYRYGTAFVNEYLYYHVFSRTITVIEGHNEARWWYVREIMQKFYPWWTMAPFAIIFHTGEIIKERFSWVLLVLIVIVFGFYTAAQTKMGSYVLPVYPALALLISHLVTWLYTRWSYRLSRAAIVIMFVAFAYVAIGKIRTYYVRIEESDEAVKEMGLLVGKESASPAIILFSKDEQLDPQATVFYSGKRVVQASMNQQRDVHSTTRYHNYKPLEEVTSEDPIPILLKRDELQSLLTDYDVSVIGESHDLVYATIRSHKKAQAHQND